MKFKYRIRVFEYPKIERGVRKIVKLYAPQRKEDTFIGRLCGWSSISDYSCNTVEEAKQEIENDKVYMEVKYKKPKYEYINID